MDCAQARLVVLDHLRGRLPSPEQQALVAHLSGCVPCGRLEASEQALDDALRAGLPLHRAPERLVARLAEMARTATGDRSDTLPGPRRHWTRFASPALAAALAMVVAGLVVHQQATVDRAARTAITSEAVNDHLRMLASERGPDLVSGENHVVKPWFEGRVDFAPVVPIPEVADLHLRGGSVGYFLDRKAAVVGYGLRRHAVTLLVFRASGLGLPEVRAPDGGSRVDASTERGFRVATWRVADVGYALVSDVPAQELDALAATFASLTAR
jgi:anti-sigma factor RsiW